MKDKILETEIRKHAEALSVALRKYTNEPMYCHLTLFTHDNVAEGETNPPDYCDIVAHKVDESGEFVFVVNQAFLIHYCDEGISKTTPFPYERTNDNDSPN